LAGAAPSSRRIAAPSDGFAFTTPRGTTKRRRRPQRGVVMQLLGRHRRGLHSAATSGSLSSSLLLPPPLLPLHEQWRGGSRTGFTAPAAKGARRPERWPDLLPFLLSPFSSSPSLIQSGSAGWIWGIPPAAVEQGVRPTDGLKRGSALGFGRRCMVEMHRGRAWRPSTRASTAEGGGHGGLDAAPHLTAKGEEEQGAEVTSGTHLAVIEGEVCGWCEVGRRADRSQVGRTVGQTSGVKWWCFGKLQQRDEGPLIDFYQRT
jgi:hypothetical protein